MTKVLTKWDRLPLVSSFQDEVSRMLDTFFDRDTFYDTGWSPDIDIAETENDIVVKAEIPGIDAKDIDISITDDTLTIKGEKKEEKEHNDEYYHRIERSYGSFMRTINLPASVVADKVKAKDLNGLLEINLPKVKKSKAKKISVKVV